MDFKSLDQGLETLVSEDFVVDFQVLATATFWVGEILGEIVNGAEDVEEAGRRRSSPLPVGRTGADEPLR